MSDCMPLGSDFAAHDQRIDLAEPWMSEGRHVATGDREAKLFPEVDGWPIGGNDEIELHRTETEKSGSLERELPEGASYPAAAISWRDDERSSCGARIPLERSNDGGSSDTATLLEHERPACRRKPEAAYLLIARVVWKVVGFALSEHLAEDGGHLHEIEFCGGTNRRMASVRCLTECG